MFRLLPDRFTLLLAALGVLGASIVLLRVWHGVGVNGDATYHIGLAGAIGEVARGLDCVLGQALQPAPDDTSCLSGASYLPFDVSALWPPLYPAMLAAASGFVLDPRDVAGALNAILFGLTVFVAGQWMRPYARSRPLVVGGGWRSPSQSR